jgi:hypothetical protein
MLHRAVSLLGTVAIALGLAVPAAVAEECGRPAGSTIIVVIPGGAASSPCGTSPIIRSDDDAHAPAARAAAASGNGIHREARKDGDDRGQFSTDAAVAGSTEAASGSTAPGAAASRGNRDLRMSPSVAVAVRTPRSFTTGSLVPFTIGSVPFTTGSLGPFTTGSLAPFTTGSLPPFTTGSLAPFTTGTPGVTSMGIGQGPHEGDRHAHGRSSTHQ